MISIVQNQLVVSKFDNYPNKVKPQMDNLRSLILQTAEEIDSISEMEETLKWGEPSYLVKKGSTIRIDWKPKAPNQYAIYFKCTSSLVETFKVIFGDQFKYEKNRAVVFEIDEKVPTEELKMCIGMALQYHDLKNKPLLGYK